MKAKTTLLSGLLLCASWLVAQTTSPSSTGQTSPSSGTSSTAPQTQATPNQSNAPDSETGSATQGTSGATQNNPGQNSSTQNNSTMTQPNVGTPSGTPQSGAIESQNGAMSNQNGQNRIKGCLSGAAASGIFVLTDSQTGANYTLVGNIDKLRTHVGEEIEVNGQPMGGSGSSAS